MQARQVEGPTGSGDQFAEAHLSPVESVPVSHKVLVVLPDHQTDFLDGLPDGGNPEGTSVGDPQRRVCLLRGDPGRKRRPGRVPVVGVDGPAGEDGVSTDEH